MPSLSILPLLGNDRLHPSSMSFSQTAALQTRDQARCTRIALALTLKSEARGCESDFFGRDTNYELCLTTNAY